MTTILAIVGPSGAGKTYASLRWNELFKIPYIVSSTTRPKRPEEINGRDHWFKEEKDLPEETQRLAYTEFGGYKYWAEHPSDDTKIISYVIDEKGLLCLLENYSTRYKIISIYINRPDRTGISEERQQRDQGRLLLGKRHYKYHLENSGSLEEYNQLLEKLGKEIIENYG